MITDGTDGGIGSHRVTQRAGHSVAAAACRALQGLASLATCDPSQNDLR